MEKLKQLINETANAGISIMVNKAGKWSTVIGNTKVTFVSEQLPTLCEDVATYITTHRREKTPTAISPKKYTL